MKTLRIALAQINPTVGHLSGNVRKIIAHIEKAKKIQADIVTFPELAVTGYPPEDLLLKSQFVEDGVDVLDRIAPASQGIVSIVGFVDSNDGIYNAAAVMAAGRIVDVYHKKHLPNYGVFDEQRYFRAGKGFPLFCLDGICFGVTVCEDIWYEKGPAMIQSLAGAQLIVNMNASPYHVGKAAQRETMVSARARECGAAIVYVNMVGGQDELVFDGGSFVVDGEGEVLVRGRQFHEEMVTTDIAVRKKKIPSLTEFRKKVKLLGGDQASVEHKNLSLPARTGRKAPLRHRKHNSFVRNEEVYRALLLGTKDYTRKNGFRGVTVGISGGVDSALVTAIAVDALGKENVHGLFMPSRFTSRESRQDSRKLARNLGIRLTTISIDSIFSSYLEALAGHFRGRKGDVTEENLQARIRGNLLMAFSNKFGWLVLTTGNKSEMSVGYATLYGDMAGGFAVIKDVPKTMVYELCRWRNDWKKKRVIPERILWKEPTAELRPDQRDTDSLPPYPVLDPILRAYIEEDLSFEDITKEGCDVECTKKVIRMVDQSEYKRRQAPPGIKITPRAFGKDRRFPLTNRYRSY